MECTRFSVVMGLVLALLPLRAFASGCSRELTDVRYSAKFRWAPSAARHAHAPLRVRLGFSQGSRIWAEITSLSGTCEAVCGLKGFESLAAGAPSAIRLDCRGERFGALATPASLVFKPVYGRKPAGLNAKPVLRFGTWLNGYQDATLDVELDRLASNHMSVAFERRSK